MLRRRVIFDKNEPNTFKFGIHDKVKVILSGQEYNGIIWSYVRTYTGSNRYALRIKYRGRDEIYWFSENEILEKRTNCFSIVRMCKKISELLIMMIGLVTRLHLKIKGG